MSSTSKSTSSEGSTISVAGSADAPTNPKVQVVATLPNNQIVNSTIAISAQASQYIPVTIKPRATKRIDILSPSIHKVDFISIILDPSNKPPSNSPLYCVFGNEGFGRDDDDYYYEEGRREHHRGRRDDDNDKESKLEERIERDEKEEKRIEAREDRDEKRYKEDRDENRHGSYRHNPHIILDQDLVIIGRPLIKLIGNVNTVTFHSNYDEDIKVTIYVGYEV